MRDATAKSLLKTNKSNKSVTLLKSSLSAVNAQTKVFSFWSYGRICRYIMRMTAMFLIKEYIEDGRQSHAARGKRAWGDCEEGMGVPSSCSIHTKTGTFLKVSVFAFQAVDTLSTA
jgi:hypothetical protein